MRRTTLATLVLFVLSTALAVGPVSAQYFGRNKVQYDDFEFRTFSTDHFDIYYYPEEKQATTDAARMAERWYQRHSRTFLRDFQENKPLIFYANGSDFQQTNVVQGQVGQGTGGVTESVKERVVMPMGGSYKETDHVLGHELVHSFQYDIALNQSDGRFSLRNLPLWFVEGMAEYLSVGRQDAHTAMWMRDALVRDDLPTVRQMTRKMNEYFPYRYGQAYMAYIGGKYGDATVTDLYKLSGRVGVDSAFVYTLGISSDSLSKEWKQSIEDSYADDLEGRTPADSVGQAVVGTPGDERQFNISPSVSPDGRYVAYISRQNLFTTNLFVADAETGEVVQQLEGTQGNPHFDALRFIDSAGSWSPDGRQFAFITYAEGTNEINTFDVTTGEVQMRTAVEGVGAIKNLAWSPNGRYIAFTGIDGGLSDLYLYDLQEETVRQLTNDRYAALQPTWAPDGETLAFTTDRGPGGTDFESLTYGNYRVGLIDVQTRDVRTVRPFPDAMHHNPQFSPDGESLYFISDQDGFKDIYRYNLATEATYRVTRLKTGASGITALSPALSVAQQSGRMMFSVFSNSGYAIVSLGADETEGERIAPQGNMATVMGDAGQLPPVESVGEGLVSDYLKDPLTGLPELGPLKTQDASERLQLDGIAPPSVGASTGGGFGTQVSGGVGFFFSDMLGNQSLDVYVQANGRIQDVGGGVFYTNEDHRLNYGGGLSHVPSAFGQVGRLPDGSFVQIVQRVFRTQVSTQASYPLSEANRFELSLGGTRFASSVTARAFNRRVGGVQEVDPESLGIDAGFDPFYLGKVGLAYVGDFSSSGLTSPLQGGRYRFQVTPQFGSRNFVSVLADYRRYLYEEPVTFAIRGLHQGNYGAEFSGASSGGIGDLFVREALGDPYQLGFVRGYSFSSIFSEDVCQLRNQCDIDNLYGTRVALASAEIRVPLLGPEVLGLSTFQYLPTDLVLFGDAGLAWTGEDWRDLRFKTSVPESGQDLTGQSESSRTAQPVTSAGISARVNLLGSLVFEAFYARTFQRSKNWDFGLILRPGW